MTATLKLPSILSEAVDTERTHSVSGPDVAAALSDLFSRQPGLRNHVVDETGAIRPHVLVFVDGRQATLRSAVGGDAEIWLIQAVSGGSPLPQWQEFPDVEASAVGGVIAPRDRRADAESVLPAP